MLNVATCEKRNEDFFPGPYSPYKKPLPSRVRGAKSWRNATHDPDKPVLEALGYSSSLKPHQAEAATPAPILLMLLLILRRVLQLLALLDSIGRPRPPRCHVALGSLLGTQPKPAPAVEHPKPRGPGPRNYYSTILLYDYITLLLLFYYITIPPPFRIFLGPVGRKPLNPQDAWKALPDVFQARGFVLRPPLLHAANRNA